MILRLLTSQGWCYSRQRIKPYFSSAPVSATVAVARFRSDTARA